MTYKTELHCHTSDVSKCGKSDAREAVEFYLTHGYTTVVLTNHFSKNTFNCERFGDQSNWTWEQKVNFFYSGYEKMLEAADGRLNILYGCEFRSLKNPSDFLIYGMNNELFLAHPDLMDLEIKYVSPIIRESGALFVQAHPFRDGMQITKPALLDGVEVWNGNCGKDNRNDITDMWADRYGLIKTGGTDYHKTVEGKMPIGIETDFPITTNEQLIEVLKSGNYKILKNKRLEDGITEVLI